MIFNFYKKIEKVKKNVYKCFEVYFVWGYGLKCIQCYFGFCEYKIVEVIGQFFVVRFVCIDVEVWEKNLNIIIEVGVVILDIFNFKDMVLGENGQSWFEVIEVCYFWVVEYIWVQNKKYVKGCFENFDFG